MPSAHFNNKQSISPAQLQETDGRTVDQATRIAESATELANSSNSGFEVPGYQIIGEIARGGMGIVLLARDLVLDRDVAIKVLGAGQANSAAAARFVRESKITSQLAHPGIPPIHALGSLPDGSPFLAMKLIRGKTLSELLKLRSSAADDLPRFLQVFEQVCLAVGFAHSQNVIHRDLKPMNVMVGAFGEVQVMDWGLAKALTGSGAPCAAEEMADDANDSREMTVAGAVMGTPAYMAPEQARGEPLDARADVFALGAILCEILTGLPPYAEAKSSIDTIRLAAAGNVSSALERLSTCPADAELIGLATRCLAAGRDRRFGDAKELAEAVSGYRAEVENRLRQAETERAAAVAKAAEQRKRRKVQLALAGVAVAMVLGAISVWFYISQDRAARRSETARTVEGALVKGEQFRDRARGISAGVLDLSACEAALALWEQAREAVEQADGFSASGLPSRDHVERIQRLAEDTAAGRSAALELAERARIARKFSSDLENAKALASNQRGSHWDIESGRLALQKAFQDAGIEVDQDDLDLARQGIRALPTEICPTVIAALDQWIEFDPNLLNPLTALAQEIDDEPWMLRFREARLKSDNEGLKRLAVEIVNEPLPAGTLNIIGNHVMTRVSEKEGLALMRSARARYPGDFWINNNLGIFLHLYAQTVDRFAAKTEVIGCLHAATAANPNAKWTRMSLAAAYWQFGDYANARREREWLVEMDPEFSVVWQQLAFMYAVKKERPEMVRDAARRAIARPPEDSRVYIGVVGGLVLAGYTEEALAAAQEWSRRFPDDPLGKQEHSRVQKLAATKEKFPAFLKGEFAPTANEERLPLIEWCMMTANYAAAARLAIDVFASDPQLAADPANFMRYNAACAAALAVAGREQDAGASSDTERSQLRGLALDWLRADLALWTARFVKGEYFTVAQTLRHWLRDTDLVAIRDFDELMKASDAERASFSQLWADVQTLLKKAEAR